jgi:TolA-binding protein
MKGMLGAALLRAGRPEGAAAVYLEDLRRHPENRWALYGLAQSLAAKHKDAEAFTVRQRFDKAWTSADHNADGIVLLTASPAWAPG